MRVCACQAKGRRELHACGRGPTAIMGSGEHGDRGCELLQRTVITDKAFVRSGSHEGQGNDERS
jgi:hypothetical protein